MTGPRVLLVAKPWRGGLAHYLLRAMRRYTDGRITWLASYPHSGADMLRYRLSRTAWRGRLVKRINGAQRDIALFVNVPPDATHIAPHPGNILWLTDAPDPGAPELQGFARIFTSDPGHAGAVSAASPEGCFVGSVPFACDPDLHRPAAGPAQRDVCFIGNRDDKRDAHLAALLASGASATVVGNYFARHPLFWRHPASFRPRVSPQRMGAVYARHRVSLNVHARVVREGTNMRTFEAAACGIAQLVETRPGLCALFEAQRELATYAEPAELAAALQRLLRDPDHRRSLAQRARERVLAEHTYDHRLRTLLGS